MHGQREIFYEQQKQKTTVEFDLLTPVLHIPNIP